MSDQTNPVLARWNQLSHEEAACEALPCCGSAVWAASLAAQRPFFDLAALEAASAIIWRALSEADWQQAFDSHPRIGQRHAQSAAPKALRWSADEQQAATSDRLTTQSLDEANRRYEAKFHRIFIVCAAAKTTPDILTLLEGRMNNDPATELREAAEQQRQITLLRLRRWLEGT